MKSKDSADNSPLVLIVDDDESIRSSTERLIRSFGFRTEVFASAREFLDSSRSQDPACLILDVRMPGMDGLELQRRLAGTNDRLPIIFATAQASDEEARRAMEAGAVTFLRKPINQEALINAIQTALRRGRQDDDEDRRPESNEPK
jgi:FixJ family two-component response regulator